MLSKINLIYILKNITLIIFKYKITILQNTYFKKPNRDKKK